MTKPTKSAKKRVDSGTRWRQILIWGGGITAFVVLVAVVLAGTLNEAEAGIPEGTEEIAVGDPAHVEGDIHDDDEVPAGGEHNQVWANCGFYSEPVAAENAVHSLEHGAVWITYQPSLPEDQLAVLRSLGSPVEKVLVSPVEGQEVPMMATAWGYQLELQEADDTRIGQFIAEFAGSLGAPEPGGSCRGGIGNPE